MKKRKGVGDHVTNYIKWNGYNNYNATIDYKDKYNKQRHCKECKKFRSNFWESYPETIGFRKQFGIDSNYPLEILDWGFDDEKDRVYYSVKGELLVDKIQIQVSNKNIVLHNWNVENEGCSNTCMDKPYFIVGIQELFIEDVEYKIFRIMPLWVMLQRCGFSSCS